MGKVGSTSLEKSIKNGIHWHSFYPFFNSRIYKSKYNLKARTFSSRIFAPIELFLIRLLVKLKIKFSKDIKIITVVRDPISRNISFLFQYMPIVLYELYFTKGLKRVEMKDTLDNLEQEFYNKIWHTSAHGWLEYGFKKIFGIDIIQ